MITLIWLGVIIAAVVLYFRQAYSRFSRYGVKHFPIVPPVGNLMYELLQKKHIAESLDDMYQGFPEERFVGRYEFTKCVLIIRDLELVKKITVKDFEHFLDHRLLVGASLEPLFGRNLFSLRGQEWKDMRSTLSPAFTSSKMRAMVAFMMEVSDQMIACLKKQITESGVDYVDVDTKDLTTRFANDIIASCAFGLKVNSHADRDNQFYDVGRDIATSGFRRVLILFGYSGFPAIMKIFKFKVFSDVTMNFFKNIVMGTMDERRKKNIYRPDMIHLLMEAKKGKLTYEEKSEEKGDTGFATVEESEVGRANNNTKWSDIDLAAQAFMFLLAGFETVSAVMSFLLYEVAVDPDVQERLVQEIRDNDAQHGGKFDFNSIQKLPYLDMVISEVLRLWPPAHALDRVCTKDYNLGKANAKADKDYIIRKGEAINIPTWAFHHNPEFWPDPYKPYLTGSNPERFSEQNKHTIKPFSYVPFGVGPRNCIASRFALCEIKVMAYKLFQQMEVSPCEKTRIPAVLKKDTFNLKIQGGEYVRFTVRR